MDRHIEETCKFAMALVDYNSEDPNDLKFKRGTLIEDIEVYTHLNIRIFNGRVRSSRGRIPADSIVLICEDRLQKVLERYSSQKLFTKALDREHGWDFVQTLFGERSDDINEPQLTIGSTSLKTSYVDWNGQLHDQALHFAVIAQDYDMIRFLHYEMGQDINKSADFPALFSRHPTDDPVNWELYVSRRSGPPLTAAINRYVRSKHVLQEVKRKAEINSWRKMIQELIKLGADWSKFADHEELLGPQPAFRADAPSVLWRAIDYDDRAIYGLILDAQPPLKFEWLPWKPFFEAEHWWAPFKSPLPSLKGEDAKNVIGVLRGNPDLASSSGEETLKSSITRLIWEKFEDLRLSGVGVNILFEQLMAQVTAWHSAEDGEQQKAVVRQLEAVIRANPDLESWVKPDECPSVLHFCVAENLYDVLNLFLLDGRSAAYINYNFEDGESLLDKAKCHGEEAMVQLLMQHKAMPARRVHGIYTPAESTRTNSSRRSSKSPRPTDEAQKRLRRLQIPTSTRRGALSPTGSRQLTPISPASSRYSSASKLNGQSSATQVSSRAQSTQRPEAMRAQVEPEIHVRLEDMRHYSDAEFQFGGDRIESPAALPAPAQDRAHPAPPELRPASTQSSTEMRRQYSAALKDGLNQNIQWAAPSVPARPKLSLGRNSFQGAQALAPCRGAPSPAASAYGEKGRRDSKARGK